MKQMKLTQTQLTESGTGVNSQHSPDSIFTNRVEQRTVKMANGAANLFQVSKSVTEGELYSCINLIVIKHYTAIYAISYFHHFNHFVSL